MPIFLLYLQSQKNILTSNVFLLASKLDIVKLSEKLLSRLDQNFIC